jgi:hypothetical protein
MLNADCLRLKLMERLAPARGGCPKPSIPLSHTIDLMVITRERQHKFQQAVEVHRWLRLGITLRVISWPMGFSNSHFWIWLWGRVCGIEPARVCSRWVQEGNRM